MKIILDFTIPYFYRKYVSAALQYGGYGHCREVCGDKSPGCGGKRRNDYVSDFGVSARTDGWFFRADGPEIQRSGDMDGMRKPWERLKCFLWESQW